MQQFIILMVCTGNTCRSPMAQALARRIIADRKGVDEKDLAASGVRVQSAGARAMPGAPAAPEAVEVLAGQGLDLSGHRSRPLSREMIRRADVIYAMTRGHREAVLSLAPDAAAKVALLDPEADIDDPLGADVQSYARTAAQIREALERQLQELPI